MSSATPITLPTRPLDTSFGETVSVQGSRPDYSINDPLSMPSGFTNYSLQEMRVTTVWKKALADIYEKFGFARIDNAPVEYARNLQLTGGLDKQIFGISRLQDGGLTKLGLPFDRTVPMARFIAANHSKMHFPYWRYDIDWSWRGEHATTGRYRAFIQADVDIVAPQLNAIADARCVAAIVKGLEELKVPNCVLYLNHVEIARDFLRAAGIDATSYKDALRVIDKLKPDNEKDVIQELMQTVSLTEEQAAGLLKAMSYRGPISDFKFPHEASDIALRGLQHLMDIQKYMAEMDIDPKVLLFAPNLARGLDYYTGVVFETFMPGKEKYGSIASGGRYDDLVNAFNKDVQLQGVGGSIGLTRLFDVMKMEKLLDLSKETTASVFVGYRTPEELPMALELDNALRKQGISAELNLTIPKVSKQLAFADAKGIPLAAMVMNQNEIVLKDMAQKKTKAEQTPQKSFTTVAEAALAIAEAAGTVSQGQAEPDEAKSD